jgi:transposase
MPPSSAPTAADHAIGEDRRNLVLVNGDSRNCESGVGADTGFDEIEIERQGNEGCRQCGMYGLHDELAAVWCIERHLCEEPTLCTADGSTHWSTRKFGEQLNVSHMMVARVWRKHALRSHRLEGYMASNDPDFETKAAEIIGLYLHPPQHAAVFCVDEKTAIQALDRKDPVLPLSPGRAERHGFEYFRHGTLSLYAAFNTRTGEVLGKTAARHTSAEFVAFLTDIVANQPRGKEIHVIADNLSAHKSQPVKEFLETHRKVHLHFTPTYFSWLNQVELWFSKIERDVIARGVFTSVPDLKRKLMRYIRQYNKAPTNVKWKYFDPSRRITTQSDVTAH